MSEKNIFIGLRREDKSFWERRTPLPPHTCKEIMDKVLYFQISKHPNILIIVQPCTKRIFNNVEYEKVGCLLDEDLTRCELIVCIKEIPDEKFIPNKTYLFWSHTIKAQPDHMAMLDKMLELKIRHIDYEKILDETGNNITAFPYAGTAGAINILSEYGKWLLRRGINNPFLSIGPPHQYFDIKHAYSQIQQVAKVIQEVGLSEQMDLPLIIGVIGSTGKCGKGTLEALANLPTQIVKPSELQALVEDKNNTKHRHIVYICPFKTQDLVRLTKNHDQEFESKDYYEHPNKYTPVFHDKYLPYLSIIVNDIYWEHKFPRYITNTQMKELAQSGRSRLQAVADVTCDKDGSIQFLKKYTTPEDPVYYYNPITEDITDAWKAGQPQIMYMSIDYLPSLLPYDASMHFGKYLVDIAPQIALSDASKQLSEQGLPKYLEDATITCHGQLTTKFEYIQKLRQVNEQTKSHPHFQQKKALKQVASFFAFQISGHLFDSGAINKILDAIEQCQVTFNIVDVKVGGNNKSKSSAVIQMFSKHPEMLQDTLQVVQEVASQFDVTISLDF